MISITFGVLLTLTVVCDSARILVVIPTPSISHQVVYRPVTLELAKRGHDVVVITTDPMFEKGKAPANYTEIDVHDISYELWQKFVEVATETDFIKQVKIGLEQIEIIFENQLKTKEVQKLLTEDKKIDLLIIEYWVVSTLALTHIFKVPTIYISTLGPTLNVVDIIGAPSHPILYPSPLQRNLRNLSVWGKISELYIGYLYKKVITESEISGSRRMKKMFGPDFPDLSDLKKNVDMLFLNAHPMWDFNRPAPPNVIYLGGLHQAPPKMLPQKLKSYLDSSSNGVIYMSLGTNVKPSMLPRETIDIFLNVFADLPYNVLWKWDQDELDGRPNNLNISKWFPQPDLLRHPNVKLFITQGGLQSTDEALVAGVPLIGIPMIGDQFFNTALYEHYKIGVRFEIETLTKEGLQYAINTLLKDDSYRNNIVRLNKVMKDQPQTSLERAVWWTEYVLRHGGARHLRSPAANITWAEYLELELLAVVLTAVLAVAVIFFLIVKLLMIPLFPYTKYKTN